MGEKVNLINFKWWNGNSICILRMRRKEVKLSNVKGWKWRSTYITYACKGRTKGGSWCTSSPWIHFWAFNISNILYKIWIYFAGRSIVPQILKLDTFVDRKPWYFSWFFLLFNTIYFNCTLWNMDCTDYHLRGLLGLGKKLVFHAHFEWLIHRNYIKSE